MYQTLSTDDAVNILRADAYANWSLEGARALVEYLKHIEDKTGGRIEIDAMKLRTQFREYPNAIEAASDMSDWEYRPDEHGAHFYEEDAEDDARLYLLDRTSLIPFDGGVVVKSF